MSLSVLATNVAYWARPSYEVDLDRQGKVWQAHRSTHYRYTVHFGGASVLGFYGEIRMEVLNNVPFQVKQMERSGTFNPREFDEVNTIDRLFGFIRSTVEHRHDRVEMKYDSRWGFPVHAMMSENTSEGDTEISVSDFTVLP